MSATGTNRFSSKSTPIATYDALLEKGSMPDAYRPTLYDFVAFDADEERVVRREEHGVELAGEPGLGRRVAEEVHAAAGEGEAGSEQQAGGGRHDVHTDTSNGAAQNRHAAARSSRYL